MKVHVFATIEEFDLMTSWCARNLKGKVAINPSEEHQMLFNVMRDSYDNGAPHKRGEEPEITFALPPINFQFEFDNDADAEKFKARWSRQLP